MVANSQTFTSQSEPRDDLDGEAASDHPSTNTFDALRNTDVPVVTPVAAANGLRPIWPGSSRDRNYDHSRAPGVFSLIGAVSPI